MSNLIPDNFVPFLDSLRLKSLTSDANQISCLFPPISAVTALGTHLTKPAVNLYQMTPTEVTLTGFRKKLLQVLRSENHVANEEIVDAILGCVLGAATSGIDRVKFLDDLLSRFSNAEVSHFYILPLNAVMKPMKIEGYVLSEVDIGLLTSRANRAGSDFAKLYATGLKGRLCLQSPIFRHVVIDFIKLGLKHALLAQPSWRDLLLRYFERVARQHFEYMWSHLDRTQMLSTPFGAHILDAQNFRQGFAQFSKRISIYLDFSNSGAGYVVPEATDMEFNEPGPESIAYARYLEHRSNYRISEVGDSELGRTLYTCAGFCQQATRFLESGRNDDAALYATICLEHLFSEKQSTSEAVCTRAAVLTHKRLVGNFTEAEKELRKLYDARSAFVHSGTSITAVQAERLIAYARETLRSMLVLHLKPENRAPGFLKKWVKDLDFIVSGFEANRTFEDSFLAENGIFRS